MLKKKKKLRKLRPKNQRREKPLKQMHQPVKMPRVKRQPNQQRKAKNDINILFLHNAIKTTFFKTKLLFILYLIFKIKF